MVSKQSTILASQISCISRLSALVLHLDQDSQTPEFHPLRQQPYFKNWEVHIARPRLLSEFHTHIQLPPQHFMSQNEPLSEAASETYRGSLPILPRWAAPAQILLHASHTRHASPNPVGSLPASTRTLVQPSSFLRGLTQSPT